VVVSAGGGGGVGPATGFSGGLPLLRGWRGRSQLVGRRRGDDDGRRRRRDHGRKRRRQIVDCRRLYRLDGGSRRCRRRRACGGRCCLSGSRRGRGRRDAGGGLRIGEPLQSIPQFLASLVNALAGSHRGAKVCARLLYYRLGSRHGVVGLRHGRWGRKRLGGGVVRGKRRNCEQGKACASCQQGLGQSHQGHLIRSRRRWTAWLQFACLTNRRGGTGAGYGRYRVNRT
jgi:hypothetical protein